MQDQATIMQEDYNEANDFLVVEIKIPLAFFQNPQYKDLPTEAKLLYALMLDRYDKISDREKTLATLNKGIHNTLQWKWIPPDLSIYIHFPQTEAMKILNVKSKQKISKLYKALEQVKLIKRVKQGFTQPDKIYLTEQLWM